MRIIFLVLLLIPLLMMPNVFSDYKKNTGSAKTKLPEGALKERFLALKKRELLLKCMTCLLYAGVALTGYLLQRWEAIFFGLYILSMLVTQSLTKKLVDRDWTCPHCGAPLSAGYESNSIQIHERCRSCGETLY